MAVVQGRMRRVTSLKRIVESIEDVEYPSQGSLLAQRPRCRTHRARRKREPSMVLGEADVLEQTPCRCADGRLA